MCRLIFLLATLITYNVDSQENCHWLEVQNTPNTAAFTEYFFADGSILVSLYSSGEIGISNDKGVTWRYSDVSNSFGDAIFSSYQEDAEGNFYYSVGYKQIHRLDRTTLETELVHLSSGPFFEYGVGKDHLYIADGSDIIVKHIETGETEAVEGGDGNIVHINVDQNENILFISDNGSITLLDKELNEISSFQFSLSTQYDDIETTISNHLIFQEEDQFSYSLDYGQTWLTEDTEGVLFYNIHQGNEIRYFVVDSIVYSYDLEQEVWLDTVVTDTNLQIEGASDYLYVFPNSTSYMAELYYVDPTNGLSEINLKIGAPDVYNITALNDSVFFLHDENLLYINGEYTPSHAFRKIHQLSTGEFIGSTYTKLLISWNGDAVFEELATPVPIIDGVTKDENDRLFIFRYDGIWISLDKGLTWSHECPPAYFPAFDVYERSVKPKASNLYYGLTSLNNVLVYDHNIDDVKISIGNSNTNLFAISQFEINALGDRYYTTRTISTGEHIIRKKVSNVTTELDIPNIELKGTFALDANGDLYIHDGKSIYRSKDGGDTWLDISANLPTTLFINSISTGHDGSIYLACRNGNVFKCGEEIPLAIDNVEMLSFTVFPNPVSDVLVIKMKAHRDSHVDIYNMMGQKIRNKFITKDDSMVDISGLPPGMYVLHLVVSGESVLIEKS